MTPTSRLESLLIRLLAAGCSRAQPARASTWSREVTRVTTGRRHGRSKRAGIFPFVCAVQAHLPMMWGQLVVLPASSMSE